LESGLLASRVLNSQGNFSDFQSILQASSAAMQDRRKLLTVQDAGRRGGKARAKKYSPEQLREWAKLGGWPKGRPRKKKKRRTRKRGRP
jgi:hypothetical protein